MNGEFLSHHTMRSRYEDGEKKKPEELNDKSKPPLIASVGLLHTRPPGMPLKLWEDASLTRGGGQQRKDGNYMGYPETPTLQRLKKRPRSPTGQNKITLKPIHSDELSLDQSSKRPGKKLSNQSSQSSTFLEAHQTSPRMLHSFVKNFLADELGNFRDDLDLQAHARDSGTIITDSMVHEVANLCPNLITLRMTSGRNVTDAGIWAIVRYCTKLRELYMGNCELITMVGFRALAQCCPKLRLLDLSECHQVNDSILKGIAAGCWLIESLVLRRCQQVTDAGLAEIASCCKNLKHLDVSECQGVGEFGDAALLELGRNCSRLETLDLYGCRHVRDAGLKSVAIGCKNLKKLRLSGCTDISSKSVKYLAANCHELVELSLGGFQDSSDADLIYLSTNCRKIKWLDISGSRKLHSVGIDHLMRNCESLEWLSIAKCQYVDDQAMRSIAEHGDKLRSLNISNCDRITEAGVQDLLKRRTRLLTLDVTDCKKIGRRFLQKLVDGMEFVEWAHTFVGFQPLPNAEELIAKREELNFKNDVVVKIQALIRGCLARGGVHEHRLRCMQRTTIPKIQARIRGYLTRKHLRAEKLRQIQRVQSVVIQRVYRGYRARLFVYRFRRVKIIQGNEEQAAIIFQKIYRGHRDRVRFYKLQMAKQQQEQMEARRHALLELAAIRVQQLYRGHRGKADAKVMRLMREMAKAEKKKELEATCLLQRVYRGHRGRRLRDAALQKVQEAKHKNASALEIQSLFRGRQGRKAARKRFLTKQQRLEDRAALIIQYNWRGMRGRHLGSLMLSLLRLKEMEQIAARKIQKCLRGYQARGIVKTIRFALKKNAKEKKASLQIQRVFRGHKGREKTEVFREIKKMEGLVKPLVLKEQSLERELAIESEKLLRLQKQLDEEKTDETLLGVELEKIQNIKTKYHDSARITGTSQRFLTKFLQVQLAEQLRNKRAMIAVERRNIVAWSEKISELEKALRTVKRQLQPLTEGVERDTKVARSKRLRETVQRDKKAALVIQRNFRGYRTRVAVSEGANYWVELFNEEYQLNYYYNTFTQVTRWSRPLAMDIFQDKLTSLASPSDPKWVESFDEASGYKYYFHTVTGEYRWDPPPNNEAYKSMLPSPPERASRSSPENDAFDDFFRPAPSSSSSSPAAAVQVVTPIPTTTSVSTTAPTILSYEEQRRRFDRADKAALIQRSRTVRAVGENWEERIASVDDDDDNTGSDSRSNPDATRPVPPTLTFYYNPSTDACQWSLSPRSVHSGGGPSSSASSSARRRLDSTRTSSSRLDSTRLDSTRTSARLDSTRLDSARRGPGSLPTKPPLRWQLTYHYQEDDRGRLVPTTTTDGRQTDGRSAWSEGWHAEYQAAYYYNGVTGECRWEKPVEFHDAFDTTNLQTSARKWFDAQDKQVLTSRSDKRRDIGDWAELVDPVTGHTYYYNEVTGEAKWSLSPQEARLDLTEEEKARKRAASMSHDLEKRVQKLRESDCVYDDKQLHLAWIDEAIREKDWPKVEGLVHQMHFMEQEISLKNVTLDAAEQSTILSSKTDELASETDQKRVAEEESFTSVVGDDQEDRNEESGKDLPYISNLSLRDDENAEAFRMDDNNVEKQPSKVPEESFDADKTPESHWLELVDPSGLKYYYNQFTGESQWEAPDEFFLARSGNGNQDDTMDAENQSANAALEDHWEEYKDEYGNTYYYNLRNGESSWHAPETKKPIPTMIMQPSELTSFSAVLSFEEQIRASFAMFDINGIGFIDVSELGALLQTLEVNMSPSDIEQLIGVLDITQEGKVGFSAFLNWWTSSLNNNFADGSGATTAVALSEDSSNPLNWIAQDDGQGNICYYNHITGESAWEIPNQVK